MSRLLILATVAALGAGCVLEAPAPPSESLPAPDIPRSGASHGPDADRVTASVTGSPWAVAHLVQGGLRADHGSHFGFKAIVDEGADAATPAGVVSLVHASALNTATRRGTIIDRSRVVLREHGAAPAADGETGATAPSPGAPAEPRPIAVTGRAIHFEPWAVAEDAALDAFGAAHGEACTEVTNVTAIVVTVENRQEVATEVSAELVFDCDPDPLREDLTAAFDPRCPTYTLQSQNPRAVAMAVLGAGKVFRVIGGRFTPGSVSRAEILDLEAGARAEVRTEIATPPRRLFAGEKGTFTFLIAQGADQADAEAAMEAWRARPESGQPHKACLRQRDHFEGDLRELERTESDRDAALVRLAVDALRQARYAPRGGMGGHAGVVGSKPVQVRFDGNDLPRVAAGLVAIGVQGPLDALGLVTAAIERHGGRLPPTFDENLQPDDTEDTTAQPLVAWSLAETVARRRNVYTVSEVDPIFSAALRHLAWLEERRERADSFYSLTGAETGWADSPRFRPDPDAEVPPTALDIDDLERTSWTARAYLDLADLALAMSLSADARNLRARGAAIAEHVDRAFRRSSDGLYVDRILLGDDVRLSPIRTPASVVPLALELAGPVGTAATLAFILDGNGLWGTWQGSERYMMGIPSISYDDPRLNVFDDGHRRRGQIWPWSVYMAWRALVLGGRGDAAEHLRERFLDMVAAHPEGLYEVYDFFDGAPGFGPQGRVAEGRYAPPVIQHALTAAAVLRLIYRL